jgi:hypothetical protein
MPNLSEEVHDASSCWLLAGCQLAFSWLSAGSQATATATARCDGLAWRGPRSPNPAQPQRGAGGGSRSGHGRRRRGGLLLLAEEEDGPAAKGTPQCLRDKWSPSSMADDAGGAKAGKLTKLAPWQKKRKRRTRAGEAPQTCTRIVTNR